jgi:peptidoglycan/LPS O-acetylase OafA/YrhL
MGLTANVVEYSVHRGEPAELEPGRATTQPPAAAADHLFANNVRFLSMAAIIAMHVVGGYPPARQDLIQIFKFGTIGFFLISGFLFGERIDQYTSLQYFTRRLKNVLLPWTIWYLLYCGLCIAADFLHRRIDFHSATLYSRVYADFSNGLLNTAYWFVPNLIIALAVLLVFRRKLRDPRTGIAFLALSLFYAANIYGCWIPVQHNRAVFGFVFYLWLGAWAAWHYSSIEKWVARVPTVSMVGIVVLMNVLAVGETILLRSLHSVDPWNTLRITNQMCSVVVVLAIMKLKRAMWPRFINVRSHTFGLYLTHMVALSIVSAAIVRMHPHVITDIYRNNSPGMMVLLPIMFVAVYGGSLILVKFLLSQRWLRWTVGLAGNIRSSGARVPSLQKSRATGVAAPSFTVKTERPAQLVGSE